MKWGSLGSRRLTGEFIQKSEEWRITYLHGQERGPGRREQPRETKRGGREEKVSSGEQIQQLAPKVELFKTSNRQKRI